MDSKPTALAIYGTLRPGQTNHWVVRDLDGEWLEGTIRGWQFEISWGPAQGYPGVVLDPDGNQVEVSVVHSDRLEHHLGQIDDFEGPGYRRLTTEVKLDDGRIIEAWIYEAMQDSPD